MKDEKAPETIQVYFQQSLRGSLHEEVPEVEQYLVNLLTRFLHQDQLFSIRDAEGRRVTSVAEMLEYGDIRLRAQSFKAERDVHQHVGDFLLFWSGVFPEFLPKLAAPGSKDMLLNCVAQGQMSYGIAGSFDHDPFREEARVFR
ncbi:MAG TPA: hypothetical protein VKT78_16885, partial [Fimbriimonadaceae bacterium]|nr:hypothetical protein [Fimbriimonadaceae bacterium]